MDVYRIIVSGEELLSGTMPLTDEEASIFAKIVDKLEPWGDFAPVITIENLSNQKKREEEAEKHRKEAERRKAEEERRKAEEAHKKEVTDKWKAAFVAAGWEF